MKNIYVIRHGETDFNKDGKYLGRIDAPLNSVGIAQAKRLAKKAISLKIELFTAHL